MRHQMETKPLFYILLIAAAAMMLTGLSGGAAWAVVQTETTGCAVSPVKNYGEGGFDESEFDLSSVFTDDNNDFFLDTGAQQVNPDRMIIPFEQEVFATFIFEGAGYESDFGYVKLEDVVEKDDDGNILYKKREEVSTSLISGGGADIWDDSDQFHYEYHEQSGDFDVRLKLHSLENTHSWAKAGLMVREDLDDDSQHALMVVTPGNGYLFQYRRSEGGSSGSEKEGSASYPSWLRLVRNGDTITGYRSDDGSNWNQVGSHTFPGGGGKFNTNNVHLGIAILSHDNGTLCTAEVSDYEIVGETAPSFTGIDIAGSSPAGGYQESGSYNWVYAPYNADEDELYARDAYGMLIEKFIGWENVPDEDKQPIFVEIDGGTLLDSSAHMPEPEYEDRPDNESALATWEDGTGLYFIPNGDGSVNAKDMRKSLGTFEAGTELVFFLSADHHYNVPDSGGALTYFTKEDWNPDTYSGDDRPDADSDWCLEAIGGDCVRFNKRYQLGVAGGETWRIDAGWMSEDGVNALKNNWGVELAEDDEYIMEITWGQKYEHVIVGAPADDPNQWILGFEDLKGGGDTDHNDVVFRIERKTGGAAELKLDNAIPASATGDEAVYYTGVTFETWDYMPCEGQSWIMYEVSIDGGTTWIDIPNSDWDVVKCWTESGGEAGAVDDWTPGTSNPTCSGADGSPTTYRKKRIDFSAMGMIGRELLWKASFESENENCVPKIFNVNLEGSVARHAFFSRASPVAQANVMYSGNYETPDPNDSEWIQDPILRGHVIATQLYDPATPKGGASTSKLWDAGQALADMSVADRDIYFPDVSATYVDGENLSLTKVDGKTFTGTLNNTNLSAGTLRIVMDVDDKIELYRDKFTTDLVGDRRGIGSINRFTGEVKIILAEAVDQDAQVSASASYVNLTYSGSSTLKAFTSSNLDKDLLGMNHRYPFSETDFDNDGDIDDTDRDLLIDWVRGKKLNGEEKAWPLGPVDHSMPALETPPGNPAWLYGTAVSSDQKLSYKEFRGLKAGAGDTIAETLQARRSVLYVGSRSGMLHAFDAGDFRWGNNPDTAGVEEKRGYFKDGNYGDGSELWAFIPGSLLSKMKNNLLKKQDQAFVDASPTVADIFDGSDWKTVVLSALGNGGDSLFCLDVTNPDNPQFMWEYTDPDLFRSRSSPSVAAVGQIVDGSGNPKWAAFFVSGEVANDAYPTIFVIDAATGNPISMTESDGSTITKIVLDADSNGMGGIASGQPAMIDSDYNGYVDRLYIGTDKGNMYKVNIPDDPESTDGRVSHCVINSDTETDDGDSVDTGNVGNPIYGSPAVVVDNTIASDGSISYSIRVFFGTGDSPYADEDINTAETNYHFFAYLDQDEKGACGDAKLDWLYTLPAGERVWASAFASAGQIYFGTTTAETEDPCEGYQEGADTGSLYTVDQKLEEGASLSPIQTDVGDNLNVSPVIYDEHVLAKTPSGEVDVIGDGEFNKEVKGKGSGGSKVLLWREVQTY